MRMFSRASLKFAGAFILLSVQMASRIILVSCIAA